MDGTQQPSQEIQTPHGGQGSLDTGEHEEWGSNFLLAVCNKVKLSVALLFAIGEAMQFSRSSNIFAY